MSLLNETKAMIILTVKLIPQSYNYVLYNVNYVFAYKQNYLTTMMVLHAKMVRVYNLEYEKNVNVLGWLFLCMNGGFYVNVYILINIFSILQKAALV